MDPEEAERLADYAESVTLDDAIGIIRVGPAATVISEEMLREMRRKLALALESILLDRLEAIDALGAVNP
jgi:hypothetical protein